MNKDEIIESQKKQIRKLKDKLRYTKRASLSRAEEINTLAVRCLEGNHENSRLETQLEQYIRLESTATSLALSTKKQLELSKATIGAQQGVIESQEAKIEEMKRNVNVRRGEVLRRELNYYQQDLGRVKSKLLQAKNEVEKLKIRNFKLMGYLELAIKRIANYMGKSSKYEQENQWKDFKNKNFINQ